MNQQTFTTHSINLSITSQEIRITEFSSILEQNFESKINKAKLKLISMMILALYNIKTVNYLALTNVFDGKTKVDSSLRRPQRFMADFDFPMKLILGFISNLLSQKESLTLVIYRTN